MLCTIIGAGPGLGAALVRTFAQDGLDVAWLARRPERLAPVRADEVTRGRQRGFPADVEDPDGLRAALDRAEDWAGPTSVLIYHAARMVPDDVVDLTGEALARTLRVNVGGALQAVGHVLPGMRRAGSGTVLFTGGGLALEPYPEWASLGAGKAALRNLGLGLHKALAPEGVHVAVMTVAGIIDPAGPLTPEAVADAYREVHHEARGSWRREVVCAPPGGDLSYNDPDGRHRGTSSSARDGS